ncbi:MAG: nucleoside-diphosphate-sugar epimerase, partial [Myxococcota bacterium]
MTAANGTAANGTIALTGSTGFIGQHVQSAARALGYDVAVVGRDLHDVDTWRRAVDSGATRLIHLAFPSIRDRTQSDAMMSFVETSTAACAEALDGTSMHVVLVSSAAVVGPNDVIVDEDTDCAPANDYGRAKLAQERALTAEANRGGWPLTIARVFNVLGPGQPPGLLATDLIARFATLAESGSNAPIELFPMESRRDYVDVREVADRVFRLPEGTFNLCSGEATRSLDLAIRLCHRFGIDPTRLQPAEGAGGVPYSCGNPSKLTAAGLEMTINWRDS